MIMSLEQRKIKIKPRIKLNNNICLQRKISLSCMTGASWSSYSASLDRPQSQCISGQKRLNIGFFQTICLYNVV